MQCIFILMAYLFFCRLYSCYIFLILVVLSYHHLYCYNGCEISIWHQHTVTYSSYATKGGDGLIQCLSNENDRGYYINCVDTDQCKTEKIVQGCIYLQSFQEEDFLWNVLWNLSCLKLNVFSLTKSTFYTFNSLSCWWIYCDPTDDHIFQCFSYGNKDQGHVCGKGSLAVCMCNCIKMKLAQMFG